MAIQQNMAIQQKYSDRLTPFNAVVGSFALWLFVFILAPVDPRWSDSSTGYLLILLGIAGLLLGAKLPETMGLRPAEFALSHDVCLRALTICTALGFIGLCFKIFDTIILRSVDFTQNAAVAREQIGRGETNAFAVIAAVLLPFGNASLLLGWCAKRMGIVKKIRFSVWVIAAAPGVLSALLASRSSLLIFGCLIFCAYLNLAPRIRVKHLAAVASIAILAISLFAVMFVSRVELSGMTMLMAARYSAYTQVVPLQPWAIAIIDQSGELGPLLAGYASIVQYFISGLFEFLFLVDLKTDDFGNGAYTFFFVPKFLGLISGGGFEARLADLNNDFLNPRTGVFQSFFGPLYVDFGPFMPLACALFGAIAGYLRLAILRGNIFAFPVLTFMLMQLVFAANMPSLSMNAAILSNLSLGLVYLIGSRFMQAGQSGGIANLPSGGGENIVGATPGRRLA